MRFMRTLREPRPLDGETLSQAREKLKVSLADQPVECCYLFGSQARQLRTGKGAGRLSDVDVAVMFATADEDDASVDVHQVLAVLEALSAALGREDIDITVLNGKFSPLAREAVKGIVLYERQAGCAAAVKTRLVLRYLDFAPYRAMFQRSMLAQVRRRFGG